MDFCIILEPGVYALQVAHALYEIFMTKNRSQGFIKKNIKIGNGIALGTRLG